MRCTDHRPGASDRGAAACGAGLDESGRPASVAPHSPPRAAPTAPLGGSFRRSDGCPIPAPAGSRLPAGPAVAVANPTSATGTVGVAERGRIRLLEPARVGRYLADRTVSTPKLPPPRGDPSYLAESRRPAQMPAPRLRGDAPESNTPFRTGGTASPAVGRGPTLEPDGTADPRVRPSRPVGASVLRTAVAAPCVQRLGHSADPAASDDGSVGTAGGAARHRLPAHVDGVGGGRSDHAAMPVLRRRDPRRGAALRVVHGESGPDLGIAGGAVGLSPRCVGAGGHGGPAVPPGCAARRRVALGSARVALGAARDDLAHASTPGIPAGIAPREPTVSARPDGDVT